MSKETRFGENVEGYKIPVFNEREVRASAGLLFLFLFYAIMKVHFEQNFLLLKYFIITFLSDFIIRLFISPKFSPSLILGRLIVSRQTPEFVGAAQKKFAWKIGLGFVTVMFFLLIIVNSHSVITAVSCLLCLLFLFLESAFGMCIGCFLYGWWYKEKAEYCPGEICDVTKKQDIQKTSTTQVVVIVGFALYILLAIFFLKDTFSKNPGNLWDILSSALR
ncbi:hypothetical protein WSM22_00670 [Cytophagales bacterium WSM2-2]|nr:hypothetical protein WSM22_00670 [Cytophagales bacterium WSM2-2]